MLCGDRVVCIGAVVWLVVCNSPVGRSDEFTPVSTIMGSLFDAEVLADNVAKVRRAASTLEVDAQFAYLTNWVLPSNNHAGVRLNGKFLPVTPTAASLIPNADDSEATAFPVSPAIDLVRCAVELQRTDELARRISLLPEDSSSQQRSKRALAFMLALATSNEPETNRQLDALTDGVPKQVPKNRHTWWPETTAVAFAMQQADQPDGLEGLITQIHQIRIMMAADDKDDGQDVFVAAANIALNPSIDHAGRSSDEENPFSHWAGASMRTARSAGRGYGNANWGLRPHAVQKLAGHDRDELYFPAPLTGDFEVQCDTTPHAFRSTQIAYAGLSVEQLPELKDVKLVLPTRDTVRIPVEPKLTALDPWLSRRITVNDGQCRHYLNGRLLYESGLPPGHSPWFSIRSNRVAQGSVRNLTITGVPKVPTTVRLSDPPILNDWVAFYSDKNKWFTYKNNAGADVLEGSRLPELEGTQSESLLLYHRPMMEDGNIEYEFFYEPGKLLVHPAMDRQAFLFGMNGIRVHDVTLGMYQQFEFAPDNFSEVQSAAGNLPLQLNSWNRVQFRIEGDTIRIRLNDVDVFESAIASDAPRQFGFFHYADQSRARIRNIRWTGDWQRYADSLNNIAGLPPEIAKIEAAVGNLTETFRHDFRGTKLIHRTFVKSSPGRKLTDRGMEFSAESTGNWKQQGISIAVTAGGNFDIRASFHEITTTGQGDAGVILSLGTADPLQSFSLSRTHRGKKGEEKLKSQAVFVNPDETRSYENKWFTFEAPTGTLRLVRVGRNLHYMIAEEDSEVFRVVETREMGEQDIRNESIQLAVYADNNSTVSGVWTKLSIGAERLNGPASEHIEGPPALYVAEIPDTDQLIDDKTPLWVQYCRKRMDQFVLTAVDESGDNAKRQPNPEMVHGQGTSSNSLLYLWKHSDGRPAAIGTIIVLGRGENGLTEINEFHSLSDGPVTMTESGINVWDCQQPGQQWLEVKDAPLPTAEPEALFAQAEKLTKRFVSQRGMPPRAGPALQEKPIHKYTFAAGDRILAGYLTAFSNATDPEILLHLQVRENGNGDLRWHFAGGNFAGTDVFLLLDEEVVWKESPVIRGAEHARLGSVASRDLNLREAIISMPVSAEQILEISPELCAASRPVWFPNGRQLAFHGIIPVTGVRVLHAVNIDGQAIKSLGTGRGVSFSPDGTEMVYCRNGKVFRGPTDSEQASEEIASFGTAVAWSPDGRLVVWANAGGIVLKNVKTNKQIKVVDNEITASIEGNISEMRWTPDSQTIAIVFHSDDVAGSLAVLSVDEADSFQILYRGPIVPGISWHPDSRRIVFAINDRNGLGRLYTADRSGNPPILLPSQPSGFKFLGCDWSPDGRQLTFVGTERPSTK